MSLEKPDFKPATEISEPENEEFEPAETERQRAWDKKRQEVNEIADSLGLGVDEQIKDSVVAFLVHEFTTDGSCAGHISVAGEDRHGLPYPWVDISAPEPEGWKENEEVQQEWTKQNLRQQQKMMGLLDEFYADRQMAFDSRLIFDYKGIFGAFRVQSFGAETLPILTSETQLQKLELYRQEMESFTKFLKHKYFLEE